MKLTTYITLLASGMAAATATATVEVDPIENFIATANQTVTELFHLGCNFKQCLEVLAPSIASCGIALAQGEFGK